MTHLCDGVQQLFVLLPRRLGRPGRCRLVQAPALQGARANKTFTRMHVHKLGACTAALSEQGSDLSWLLWAILRLPLTADILSCTSYSCAGSLGALTRYFTAADTST